MLVSLANGLSIFRLLAAPAIVVLIWRSQEAESSRYAAFWLVVCLQLGDMVDGHLARTGSRKLAVRNYFGEVIDPVADKMYIGAGFVTLAVTDQFSGWFVLLIVVRDLAIMGGWSLVYKRFGVRLLPNLPGKLTDGCSAALLSVILLGLSPALVGALTQITAGMIVFSGYVYARMALNAGSQASLRRLRAAAVERRDRNEAARSRVRSA